MPRLAAAHKLDGVPVCATDSKIEAQFRLKLQYRVNTSS